MRLAWLTDPHFDHVSFERFERLAEQIRSQRVDGLLLTGDISQAEDVLFQLERLYAAILIPIYYVLGNHDFYGGTIATVRQAATAATRRHPDLHYLSTSDSITLADRIGLVGEDGWGDATVGDYERSPVRLADFKHIDDFRLTDQQRWRELLAQLGRQSQERLLPKLRLAAERCSHVYVLTHVPPFREACWYEGQTTDELWAPFFVCGAVGKALREAASLYPTTRFTVLCGHTHHGGTAVIAENLTVVTGGTEYGSPAISDVFELEP